MRLEFGPFVLDADPGRTRAYYETDPGIGCECAGCRNYKRAVAELPAAVRDFFSALGIDPAKPAEVYVNCTNADRTLWYGGFYHLCGTLIQGQGGWHVIASDETGRTSAWDRESCWPVDERFHVAFTKDIALLEPGFPQPVLQLEIDASLPWLLEEENNYP